MTTVLLLVDVQRDMLMPPEPVPDADRVGPVIADVLARARTAGATVVHIRNSGGPGDPDEPGTDGWQLVHEVAEGEHVVDKPDENAFEATNLADLVPAGARVIVVGMQSEYCVRSTALGALNRNHDVTLVQGAHATYQYQRPAADISAEVEAELVKAGATIKPPADLDFA